MVLSAKFCESIIDNMINAFALHKIVLDDKEQPCDYEFVQANPAFESFTGLKRENIIGRRVSEIIPGILEDETDWVQIYGDVALNGKTLSFESYSKPLDKWYLVNAFSPQKLYFITVFNDISSIKSIEVELREKNRHLIEASEKLIKYQAELKNELAAKELQQKKLLEYQEKLEHTVYFDRLTKLPNRAMLYEKIPLVTQDKNNKTVFLIDLYNLKYVNDTMGHLFGDQVLYNVSERLGSLLDSHTQLFRFSVNEFIIIRENHSNPHEIKEYAARIIQAFEKPFIIKDSSIFVTISLGISLYPEHSSNPDELLQFADIAMYHAKKIGRNKYIIFTKDMQNLVHNRMILEKHLHSALANNEFTLYYQPQLELNTGTISGFEALIRWNNPKLGSVSPAEFIPVAEDTHLIISIGEWVLRNACYFLKHLHNLGYNDLIISVNISITQLLQEGFIRQVDTLLGFTQLKPHHLELEITESVFMESYESIKVKLKKLRDMGIKIALDDFGKGYSSLGELKQLPITTMKIDKSFIDAIETDRTGKAIVSMIIKVGRTMGLKVLAEGVENQPQKDFLIRHKCHLMQGYHFSKPLHERGVLRLLDASSLKHRNYAEFVWDNRYSIGVEDIDNQHRKIFEIINVISKMVFSNKPLPLKEVQNVMLDLKKYTVEHFRMEEDFMVRNNYVHYLSHKNMHNSFTETILDFETRSIDLTDNKTLRAILDTVFVWITDHIIKEDMKLKRLSPPDTQN